MVNEMEIVMSEYSSFTDFFLGLHGEPEWRRKWSIIIIHKAPVKLVMDNNSLDESDRHEQGLEAFSIHHSRS